MKWSWLIIGTVTSASSACVSVPGCPAVESDAFALSAWVLTAENSLEGKRYYVKMGKNAFWKPVSTVSNHVWVPVLAPADDYESADDDADECDADSHSDSRHRLLVQMVEAIRETWQRFKADSRSVSKWLKIEGERPALLCELTGGVRWAAGESMVAAWGEVSSHRQLHHAGKRTVAHIVGRRNLHQVNVARLQVLQQSHGGAPCWNKTRLWVLCCGFFSQSYQ